MPARVANGTVVALIAATLLGLIGVTATADGTIYKWTDKDGNVHYTDCPPPPGCKAETVTVPPAPDEDQVRQAQQQLDALLAAQQADAAERERERLERERQQLAALQLAVTRKRICIMAQQNLHSLLMNRPVYYIDDRGERVFLDDAAHKAEIEHQRQLIEENCGEQ